MLVTLVHLRTG